MPKIPEIVARYEGFTHSDYVTLETRTRNHLVVYIKKDGDKFTPEVLINGKEVNNIEQIVIDLHINTPISDDRDRPNTIEIFTSTPTDYGSTLRGKIKGVIQRWE